MRSMTLSCWSLDGDETTYAVIADHMLNGAVLYKDVIDIKQPGVFLIFALIQIVFGKSMLVIRLITILFVSGAAFFLYRAKRHLQLSFSSALISAIAFILMFNFYFGFASNAEIFFIFFTSMGVYLFLAASNHFNFLATGLIFGLAFIIKQLAIFDYAAIGIFIFISSILNRDFEKRFSHMALMVIGFIIPFASVHLVYSWYGYYDYYHFITYIAPGNYMSPKEWSASLAFLLKGIVVYLPFFMLGLLSISSSEWRKKISWLVSLLLFFDLLAVSFTGMAHPHYYLQLAYPISFAVGMISSAPWVMALMRKRYTVPALCSLGAVYLIFLFYFYHNRYNVKPNLTEELALYAEEVIPDGASLYAGDAPQFLYWYLDKTSPTPYVHSTLMMRDSHIQTLEIDVRKELNRIFDTEPDFIILSEEYRHLEFKELVANHYHVEGQQGDFIVYKRNLSKINISD